MYRSVDGTPALSGLAAADHADAEVIRLAAEVERIEATVRATFNPPPDTAEKEWEIEPERDRLSLLCERAVEQLAALAPRTLPGLIALARAALALADRDADGDIVARDDADLLRITLMEAVAALGEAQTKSLAQ